MAIVEQCLRNRSWLVVFLVGMTSLVTGFMTLMTLLIPWKWIPNFTSTATISSPLNGRYEHPLRQRIISTLERHQGLCYRELQKKLGAANGTLRHHLDVLISHNTITVVSVNGRSCHYAGAPSQIEVFRDLGIKDDNRAASLMPAGLSQVQWLIVDELAKGITITSQSKLARKIGRTRATVHSAIKVLRSRGIMHHTKLKLAPHVSSLLDNRNTSDDEITPTLKSLDYEWDDVRRKTGTF